MVLFLSEPRSITSFAVSFPPRPMAMAKPRPIAAKRYCVSFEIKSFPMFNCDKIIENTINKIPNFAIEPITEACSMFIFCNLPLIKSRTKLARYNPKTNKITEIKMSGMKPTNLSKSSFATVILKYQKQ